MKLKNLKKTFLKTKYFLTDRIYTLNSENLKPVERFFIDLYRVITFALTDFFKDNCTLWAAALTYLVTLAFIPALIVGLFILRIFNLYQNIFPVIFGWMSTYAPFYEPMVRQILNIADSVNLTSFGMIGIISTLVSIGLILHNIQRCLVKIWNVKITTSLPRIAANYIALLFLIPLLIGITFSLITYSSIAIDRLPPILRILLSWVVPVITMWLLILFSYVLIPQTKVSWINAAISSFLVAISIICLVSFYFKLNLDIRNYKQIFANDKFGVEYTIREIEEKEMSNLGNSYNYTNKNYNKNMSLIRLERMSYKLEDEKTDISLRNQKYKKQIISSGYITFTNFSPNINEQMLKYNFRINDKVSITSEGETLISIVPAEFSSAAIFAQIPVLLLFLYIFWIIILLGAELTYSLQYLRAYGVDKTNIKLSFAEKEIVALGFMHIVASKFINKKSSATIYDLAKELKTSPSIIMNIAEYLEKYQYIISICSGSKISYSLACPPESITIGDIIYGLRVYGGSRSSSSVYDEYYKDIIYDNKAITEKDYNTTLLESVRKKLNNVKPKRKIK